METDAPVGLFAVASVLLLLINAILVACECSLVRLRYRISEREKLDQLKRLKAVRFLLERLASTTPIMRFGIMVCSVGVGVMWFSMAIVPLENALSGNFAIPMFVLWLLLLLLNVSVISLLGFLLPRSIALLNPAKTLASTAWFVAGFVIVILPWFKLQRFSARILFRLIRIPFQDDFQVIDFEVQVQALANEDTKISPQVISIVQNALRMGDLDASAVLLPRNQVRYMDVNSSSLENIEMAQHSGHTRFPLCEDDLDDCDGLIHIKDIFRSGIPPEEIDLKTIKRDILSFKEDAPLEHVMQQLLIHKIHMALVRDEFGGVLGVVTLESIIEELIGNIDDEFDAEPEKEMKALKDSEFEIPGLTPLHDVEDGLGIKIENEDVSTFGGLITSEIGRIPAMGETVNLADPPLRIIVTEADETRVITTLVKVIGSSNGG